MCAVLNKLSNVINIGISQGVDILLDSELGVNFDLAKPSFSR